MGMATDGVPEDVMMISTGLIMIIFVTVISDFGYLLGGAKRL